MTSSSLHVALGERSYDIHVGQGLLAETGAFISPVLRSRRVIIVTDDQVGPLYLSAVQRSLDRHSIRHDSIVLAHGEQTKSFSVFAALLEDILTFKPDRNTALLALGGGVIGDITGFAASVMLRGVDFIQLPTTLLSQVDSSVGGKTGINSRMGKNLVGSFYQPRLVLCDITALKTLPRRELLAGYAEVVKYGVIRDAAFFAWLEENGACALGGDAGALSHIVLESCRNKAEVVACDEREAGLRAILNFGHTLGHALEVETAYSGILLHGEAVGIGMQFAMQLSLHRGLCAEEDVLRLRRFCEASGMPSSLKDISFAFDTEKLIAHCYQDKKAKDGGLTFVLCEGIGKSSVHHNIAREEIEALLKGAA